MRFIRIPALIGVFFAAVGGMVACGGHSSRATPSYRATALNQQFVQLQGGRLVLGGQAYQFVGLNSYAAANRNDCNLYKPLETLVPAYLIGRPVNFVLRAWANPPISGNMPEWSGLDHLVSVAHRYHIRLVLTLGNQWGDCEPGGYKSRAWYLADYRGAYLRWVSQVVGRYRNEPAILAWQLMDEAEVADHKFGHCVPDAHRLLLNFASDMARRVKAIDRHHLLGLGTIGGNQCGSANDADYIDLHRDPNIDLCEVHRYPADYPLDVPARISQCAGLGKPLLVGEYGLPRNGHGGLKARAKRTAKDTTDYLNAGAAGVLLWGYQPDKYSVLPHDPAIAMLHEVGPAYFG